MAPLNVDDVEAGPHRQLFTYSEIAGDRSPWLARTFHEEEWMRREMPPSATVPALAAFALGSIYLLLLLIASHLPAPGGVGAMVTSAIVFVYFPLAIIYHGVRIPLTAAGETLAGLVSLGLWLGLVGLEMGSDVELASPARTVALVSASLFFGMLASRIIRDRNILVPACVVAAIADLLSVRWGFTGHALRETPDIVAKLSIAVPALAPQATSSGGGSFPVLATMGVGDLFFAAFFFAAAARFQLPLRRTFCFVFPLMVAAMVLTIRSILPWMGIPGLPFVAVGFLAANARSFHFSREELKALAIVGFALGGLALTMFVVRGLAK